jgi:uncharacterized protein YcbX
MPTTSPSFTCAASLDGRLALGLPAGMSTVAALYRYPVKGLSAEPLARVALTPGETIPFDRAYAIENGPSGFDPAAPRTLAKIHFLMLMRNERLAQLVSRFDETTHTLTIHCGGAVVAEGRLDTEGGQRLIEAFFDRFAAEDLRGATKVLAAPGFSFSDVASKVVSLINLETVRAIGREIGATVHPLRFRGNLHIEGLPAWEEFGWLGKAVTIGGVTFAMTKRIERCAATNVDPETAARDLTIPASLLRAYGKADCGVYLKVIAGGTLAVGDEIKVR